jgi:Na+-transporting NADH:ubiquinone oxidoreductase subunit NqrF
MADDIKPGDRVTVGGGSSEYLVLEVRPHMVVLQGPAKRRYERLAHLHVVPKETR